jgi:hypothetical protein
MDGWMDGVHILCCNEGKSQFNGWHFWLQLKCRHTRVGSRT